jgi:hypothetical protein
VAASAAGRTLDGRDERPLQEHGPTLRRRLRHASPLVAKRLLEPVYQVERSVRPRAYV